MINRNGEFSPTSDERGFGGGDQKSSLLTEASFLANAKEQMDESREINNGLSKIVTTLNNNTFSVRVANFKSGITNPILDYMMFSRQEEKDIETRRHKESVLQMMDIRRTIDRTASQNNATLTGTVRETYFNITKSVVSAISTVITPVFKTVGFALFGVGGKQRSVVEAVDDQTQFLRSGRILDNSTIFSRFFRRGLVGSALAGAAGLAGIGRGAAQNAENKRAQGEELSLRERLVTTMNVQLGWFKNFNRLDTKETFQPNSPEMKQVSLLDRIRLATESFLEHYNSTSQIFLNEIVEIQRLVHSQTTTMKGGMMTSTNSLVDQMSAANEEMVTTYRQVSRVAGSDISFFNNRQNTILGDVKDEIKKSNNPLPTAHEQRTLFIQNAQYEELRQANEMAAKASENRKENTEGGGGLLGLGMSLGSMLFKGKIAKSIGSLGKRFIIAPVMGAIKRGGAWLAKNGFKLLLRAPFAKVFAIAGITTLLYKYLVRPMIDWFDSTFQTDIGGSIDRFGNWIGDKFTGVLDWVRSKMAKVPLIGRFFKEEDNIPEETGKTNQTNNASIVDSAKNIATGALDRISEAGNRILSGDVLTPIKGMAESVFDQVKKDGGRMMNWYGDQWREITGTAQGDSIIRNVSSGLISGADAVGERVSEVFQSGVDRVRGYDPTALASMNKQALDPQRIAQDALNSMVNPLSEASPNITDDMVRAALESRDAMFEQINELKEQRKASEEQNQEILNVLSQVAGNTGQSALASFLGIRATKDAVKNQNAFNVGGFN